MRLAASSWASLRPVTEAFSAADSVRSHWQEELKRLVPTK
jgi:hypothetical protein